MTATLKVGPLTNVAATVAELGCDPAPIFAGLGLDQATFEDPDNEIPYLAAGNLLAACVEATGCPHFGLLLGVPASPSALGITAYLLRSAPDVLSALDDFVRYYDLVDQGGMARLEVGAKVTTLSYEIHHPGMVASDQFYDHAMVVACRIMQVLCGDDWSPGAVYLPRGTPPDPAVYARVFRAPLHFDAEQGALAFDSRCLNAPLAGADPYLHRYLVTTAQELQILRPQDFTGRVRRLVRTALGRRVLSAAEIAARLGMHERTLHRRLQAEGTTFRRTVEEVRYERARELLAKSFMPLSRIAAVLGYADAAAFSRAFRRWSGAAPAAWRKEVQ